MISLMLAAIALAMFWLVHDADPVWRLAAASIGLLFLVKLAALSKQWDGRAFSRLGLVAWLFLWPGVRVEGFRERGAAPPPETGRRFLESWLTFLAGCALLLLAALVGRGESLLWNYAGLLAILMIVHLGLVEVVADGLRLLGFTPQSLFDRPFLANSLRDFWSGRWNRAFVDMNKIFFARYGSGALKVLGIFLLSGVLHEIAISFPDGQSWGLPLTYFAIQGAGMILERRFKFPRALALAWIVLPAPLLFTPMFVETFLGRGLGTLYSHLAAIETNELVRMALVAGGALHFLVLVASVQVPGRMNWREEFSRLSSLNEKVVWTYGGYIFGIIVFMGFVSFTLAWSESYRSTAGALWLAFIALFWIARVLIDSFYMEHADWPKGPLFDVGHVCLKTLFLALSVGYSLMAALAVGGIS